MEINYDIDNKTCCPKVDCRKKACKSGLRYVSIPVGLEKEISPKNGLYCNALVKYEANGEIWIYTAEGIPVKIKKGE